MTDEQIKKLDIIRGYISKLQKFKAQVESTIPVQIFGCGSRDPQITHELQKVHTGFRVEVLNPFSDTLKVLQDKIKEL